MKIFVFTLLFTFVIFLHSAESSYRERQPNYGESSKQRGYSRDEEQEAAKVLKKWVHPVPGDVLERIIENTKKPRLFAIFDEGKFWHVYRNGQLAKAFGYYVEVTPESGDLLIHKGIEIGVYSSINGFLYVHLDNRSPIREYRFVQRLPENYIHGGK